MSKDTMLLPVKLTDAETLSKSKAAAEKTNVVLALKRRAKDEGAELKLKIKTEELAVTEMLHDVHNGTEMRHVDVETNFYVDRRAAEVVRTDTGEVVHTRAMDQDEIDAHRQGALFGIEGGAVADKKRRRAPGSNGGEA